MVHICLYNVAAIVPQTTYLFLVLSICYNIGAAILVQFLYCLGPAKGDSLFNLFIYLIIILYINYPQPVQEVATGRKTAKTSLRLGPGESLSQGNVAHYP
jgi:hypothetical protein